MKEELTLETRKFNNNKSFKIRGTGMIMNCSDDYEVEITISRKTIFINSIKKAVKWHEETYYKLPYNQCKGLESELKQLKMIADYCPECRSKLKVEQMKQAILRERGYGAVWYEINCTECDFFRRTESWYTWK